MRPDPLCDGFGRDVRYLRVSVTDRCDLRCSYCMKEDVTFLPRSEVLSLEELDRLCSAFITLGVRKLRVTGGEPLVRRGILGFFAAMGAHLRAGRLDELTLTTNGTQLARHAQALAECGVKRVNVSIDTLEGVKYTRLTRFGRIERVFEGIAAAQAVGLRVKLNAMALKGVNDDEIFALADWAAAHRCDLTFIELMPMGDIPAGTRLDQFWPLDDVRAHLETRFRLTDTPLSTGGPARYVTVGETGQKIGFISPLSHNFCTSCNRVRLTCKGELYTCLGQEGATDLRPVLRAGVEGEALAREIRAAIARKPAGHAFGYGSCAVAGQMARGMNHTGG